MLLRVLNTTVLSLNRTFVAIHKHIKIVVQFIIRGRRYCRCVIGRYYYRIVVVNEKSRKCRIKMFPPPIKVVWPPSRKLFLYYRRIGRGSLLLDQDGYIYVMS